MLGSEQETWTYQNLRQSSVQGKGWSFVGRVRMVRWGRGDERERRWRRRRALTCGGEGGKEKNGNERERETEKGEIAKLKLQTPWQHSVSRQILIFISIIYYCWTTY